MLNLKSCPRCKGDVYVDSDWFGAFESCLQCGWSKDTSEGPLTSTVKLSLDKLNLELPELVKAS